MSKRPVLLFIGAAVAACGVDPEPTAVTIPFAAVVGDEPFVCDGVYAGLGTSDASWQPIDLRMFVSGVTLLAGDEEREVTLDASEFQGEGVALLDFEDDTGSCDTGSSRTNKEISGTVASLDDVDGLRFTIGLPVEQNHLDAAVSPPPLNEPGMWWAWGTGYKFLKLEGKTANKDVVYFHLGATTCSGDPVAGFSCAFENTAPTRLDWTDGDEVVLDVKALHAGFDLDAPLADGDFLDGCMSFEGDPQCPPMFKALGLSFLGDETPTPQTALSVRP